MSLLEKGSDSKSDLYWAFALFRPLSQYRPRGLHDTGRKTALGTGVGRSIALAYAREGADVAVVDGTGLELDEVAGQVRALGRKRLGINVDLTDASDVLCAARETIDTLGKVDILVNNAGGYRLFTKGLSYQVNVADLTEAEWRRVIHSNVTTTFLSCKPVLPLVMERGSGVIINLISHNVGRKARGGAAAYGAAKAAVEQLGESLAEELWRNGIAVNPLDPGWVVTWPNDDYDDEVHERMRLPDAIAEAAVFLALQTPETLTGELVAAPEFGREHGIHRPSAYDTLHA